VRRSKCIQLASLVLALCVTQCQVTPDRITGSTTTGSTQASKTHGDGDDPGGGTERGPIIRQDLPATWRPFADDSPWNTPIPAGAPTHPDSPLLIGTLAGVATNLRLTRTYTSPIWVVDSERLPAMFVRSDRIFDTWDQDRNGWSDVGVPVIPSMWAEPTSDAHIIIIDPMRRLSWEMSRFGWLPDGTPTCTTFNVWDLEGPGYGDCNEGRWQRRGGRGSGFPIVAGVIRPEEVAAGVIRHALVFSFPQNRLADDGISKLFMQPPACRSDGDWIGPQYPIQGMRFQLDPSFSEATFDALGLTREARIVARALQTYGMFDGDTGALALEVQLLGPSTEANRQAWEMRFPGFYSSIERIPTIAFRVVDTGAATLRN
jgi:hypothetical protein